MFGIVPKLQMAVIGWNIWPQWSLSWLSSPTGPFTIFFYCPMAKWLISIQNLKEMQKPTEQVNTLQQGVIAVSGLLFSRWAMIITPKNPSLALCNFCMGLTGIYQLYRKQYFIQINNILTEAKVSFIEQLHIKQFISYSYIQIILKPLNYIL